MEYDGKLVHMCSAFSKVMKKMLKIINVCPTALNTVKPVLETTCIKRPPALRDHCSDTTTVKST